jgi:hypothetical protein
MVIVMPELTGHASVQHVEVSLPNVSAFVDGVK